MRKKTPFTWRATNIGYMWLKYLVLIRSAVVGLLIHALSLLTNKTRSWMQLIEHDVDV